MTDKKENTPPMQWQRLISAKRVGMEEYHDPRRHNRSDFRRDFDRMIFSSLFAVFRIKPKCSRCRAAFLYTIV